MFSRKGIALSIVLTGVLGFGAASAQAQTLTFEGLKNNEMVNSYYNGGTGNAGSTGGPNYGISFSNASALIQNTAGGTGNFSNAPSGVTIITFLSGSAATLNDVAGFNTGFSFYYADQAGFTGNVKVYSGLNGTGSVLANISLQSTPNPYTVFVAKGVTFAGTAHSVDFGGSANYIGFDNITLNSSTPGTSATPEPGETVFLAAAGLGLVGLIVRARRRAL